jgi:hypothetical protein
MQHHAKFSTKVIDKTGRPGVQYKKQQNAI